MDGDTAYKALGYAISDSDALLGTRNQKLETVVHTPTLPSFCFASLGFARDEQDKLTVKGEEIVSNPETP